MGSRMKAIALFFALMSVLTLAAVWSGPAEG